MPHGLWWVWIVIAAGFLIGELFSMGFFLFCFGIGALASALAAYLSAGIATQWSVFAFLSLVMFFFSRKIADKIAGKQPPGVGANRTIGQEGTVTEEINNEKNSGRIRIGQEDWRAMSAEKNIIIPGTKVLVEKIDGTRAVVKAKI